MADYDIAILGGGNSGRWAASRAASWGARVALVEAPGAWQRLAIASHTLQGLLQKLPWFQLRPWIAAGLQQDRWDTSRLVGQGIDHLEQTAQFVCDRTVSLTCGQRSVVARRYLLTDGDWPNYRPDILRGCGDKILRVEQLGELDSPPRRIAILGRGLPLVEWAFALSHYSQVAVICPTGAPLRSEDRDVQRPLTRQLQQRRVRLCLSPDKIEQLGSELVITSGDAAIRVDTLLCLPTAAAPDLSLASLGLTASPHLTVNRYFRTSHPQVYASGTLLGGVDRPELSRQETEAALVNALYIHHRTVRYGRAFYHIAGPSPVVRWGLTTVQAQRRFGPEVVTVQASHLKAGASPLQLDFCKLILQGNQSDRIVGLHMLGSDTPSVTSVLRVGTGRSLTVQQLEKSQPGNSAGALTKALEYIRQRRWQPDTWRRDWSENWLNWQRSRH